MLRNLCKNNWFRIVSVVAVVAVTVAIARIDEVARAKEDQGDLQVPDQPAHFVSAGSVEIEVPEPIHVLTEEPAPVKVKQKPGFWIGVKCSAASDALRDQLGIPDRRGLVVVEVVKDSPADKAGLKRHDVLVRLGDNDLATVDDLSQGIRTSKGKQTVFQCIRRSKPVDASVTPILRPEKFSDNSAEGLAKIDDDRRKELLTRFLNNGKPETGRKNFRMMFYGPGVVMPDSQSGNSFRHDVKIEINRTNDDKVKVVVSKDGKVCKTVEGNLKNLPAEFHDAVRESLGITDDGDASIDFKIGGSAFGPGSRAFVVNTKSGNALLIPLGDKNDASGGWFRDSPHTVDSRRESAPSYDKQIASLQKQLDDLKRIFQAQNGKDKPNKQKKK